MSKQNQMRSESSAKRWWPDCLQVEYLCILTAGCCKYCPVQLLVETLYGNHRFKQLPIKLLQSNITHLSLVMFMNPIQQKYSLKSAFSSMPTRPVAREALQRVLRYRLQDKHEIYVITDKLNTSFIKLSFFHSHGHADLGLAVCISGFKAIQEGGSVGSMGM